MIRIKDPRLLLLLLALGAAGCSTNPSRQDVGIAGGAVIGGVLGSLLTEGSALGTVGGAAVGGVVGSEVGRRQDRRN